MSHKYKYWFFIPFYLFVLISLSDCSYFNNTSNEDSSSPYIFQLTFVDIDETPITNLDIKYNIDSYSSTYQFNSTTDSLGNIEVVVPDTSFLSPRLQVHVPEQQRYRQTTENYRPSRSVTYEENRSPIDVRIEVPYSYEYMYEQEEKAKKAKYPERHMYKLTFHDDNKSPLKDLAVEYNIRVKNSSTLYNSPKQVTTDNNGEIQLEVTDSNTGYVSSSSIEIKTPYQYPYLPYEDLISFQSEKKSDSLISQRIELTNVEKYRGSTLSSFEDSSIYERLGSLVNFIIEKDYMGVGFPIQLTKSNNAKYLEVFLFDNIVYNSSRVSEYDIGRSLFTDIVRELIDVLFQDFHSYQVFDGFKININSTTRRFGVDSGANHHLFQFQVTMNDVQKLQNHEITRQEFLDNSIITLNGDKVDLKIDN